MDKNDKLSWHVFTSPLSVSLILIACLIGFITTPMESLYGNELPRGDKMSTMVVRSKKLRTLKRVKRTMGPRVLVNGLSPRAAFPFTINVIDPGNDGNVATLGDEDGDGRTAANPFVNGFDLRNATVTFVDSYTIRVKIRLAKTDSNGLTPTRVGTALADPCFNIDGFGFTKNVIAFNADPPANTDYYGWDHTGPCIYVPTINIFNGDIDPDTDGNELPPFRLPNDAPHTVTSTEEFYEFIIEQPPGSLPVIHVTITGRTDFPNLDKQIANLVVGDPIILIDLEGSGTNLWDYTTENELNFVIYNIPNNSTDPNTGGPFFDPNGSFKVRINANSSADGTGEDQEAQQVTTTSSTTTTTTSTTTTFITTTTTTTTTTRTTTTTTTTSSTATTTTTTTTSSTATTTTTTTTTTTVCPTTTIPKQKCPFTQGFWKNHPGAWPVTTLILGGESYSQTELLTILQTSVKRDASLNLAHQLIAAKLNIANGADQTSIIDTITDADNLLSGFTGKLPYKVKSNTSVGQAMVNDADILDNYNNGSLTPNCNANENGNENGNVNDNGNGNDNGNANQNQNSNCNVNENVNGNANVNGNGNDNGNANVNGNVNDNGNGNDNGNANQNGNGNDNGNANVNCNVNDNGNVNENGNVNDNGNVNGNVNGNGNENG